LGIENLVDNPDSLGKHLIRSGVMLGKLRGSAGFDVDKAEYLLRRDDINSDIMRSDMLGALVIDNSHLMREAGVEQSFQQLTSRFGDALFATDPDGCNAAHRACIYHAEDTVALLFLGEMVKRKPEVIGQKAGEAHKQRTYLHLAAGRGWYRVVQWLLKENASVEQKDTDGKTAWDVAFEEKNLVMMSMIATRLVACHLDGEAITNRDPSQQENIRGSDVRRHWFRMNSNDWCKSLTKLSEVPDRRDREEAMFKLFTISKNNVSPLLLASQMNKR
jgi:ankyrin repeat protein